MKHANHPNIYKRQMVSFKSIFLAMYSERVFKPPSDINCRFGYAHRDSNERHINATVGDAACDTPASEAN